MKKVKVELPAKINAAKLIMAPTAKKRKAVENSHDQGHLGPVTDIAAEARVKRCKLLGDAVTHRLGAPSSSNPTAYSSNHCLKAPGLRHKRSKVTDATARAIKAKSIAFDARHLDRALTKYTNTLADQVHANTTLEPWPAAFGTSIHTQKAAKSSKPHRLRIYADDQPQIARAEASASGLPQFVSEIQTSTLSTPNSSRVKERIATPRDPLTWSPVQHKRPGYIHQDMHELLLFEAMFPIKKENEQLKKSHHEKVTSLEAHIRKLENELNILRPNT